MIEELTPALLSILVFVVVCVTPVVTLALSASLLYFYRRAVAHQMQGSASAGASGAPAATAGASVTPDPNACAQPSSGSVPEGTSTAALHDHARRGPRLGAACYAAGGLAFAAVFTVAAHHVYPIKLGVPGGLLTWWNYAWPAVCAIFVLTGPRIRKGAALAVTYALVWAGLVLWTSTVHDIPATRFGAIELPSRSSASWPGSARLWLVLNAPPTVLLAMCTLHAVRAVAPLALAFVAIAAGGLLMAYLALFSAPGADAAGALAAGLDVHVGWLLGVAAVLALAVFGVAGWALLRWLAGAHRRLSVSDQSLTLDALWLLFAAYYSMWLILGGLGWAATAPLAFLAYKGVVLAGFHLMPSPPDPPCGLTFLRVFALGGRSDRLLDAVARQWRYIGSVQMITGPDVARSTVAPHQFLDFLSGRLAAHFVRDADSLERSVAAWEREPGHDRRFALNNFFCDAGSWQHALPRLVQGNDRVLMDLRSFTRSNAGCVHEIEHLVRNVPLSRCLFVVDATTDQAYFDSVLTASAQMNTPHAATRAVSRTLHIDAHIDPGPLVVRHLLGPRKGINS